MRTAISINIGGRVRQYLTSITLCAVLGACSTAPTNSVDPKVVKAAQDAASSCASPKIIAIIRDQIFDKAILEAKTATQNLNNLRSAVVGRIESPVLQGVDATLQRSQCAGRVVFPLPPTVRKAFGDNTELTSEVSYSVQPAADKSGLVVEATGTEPIIQMLVDASLKKRIVKVQVPYPGSTGSATAPSYSPPRLERPTNVFGDPPASSGSSVASDPTPAVSVNPSFSCKSNLNAVEKMICNDSLLADQDRALASAYRAAKQRTQSAHIGKLEAANAKYRSQRNACSDAACVAGTYDTWTLTIENWAGDGSD